MIGEVNNIKIQGIVTVVPEKAEEVTEYACILGEKRVRRQMRLTGVESRHTAQEGQTMSQFGTIAAEELIKEINWDKESIDVLIVVTQSSDYIVPATSMIIHKNLGLEKKCMVFDINLGCSGYTAGIQVVAGLMNMGADRAVLVVGDIEYYPKELKQKEEFKQIAADMMLFGAGVTATAIERCEDHNVKFMQMTDGQGYKAIYREYGKLSQMDGNAVFNFTMTQVVEGIKQFKTHFSITEDMIDYYVFHQAQAMILNNLADLCEIPMEKVLLSLKEYGNTSSASIPVTLCANADQLHKEKVIRVLMCGFGVGLSWGCIYMELETDTIIPVITSAEVDLENNVDRCLQLF